MNDIQLFNQEVKSNRIPLEVLVEHILFRNEQTNAGLNNFNLNTATEWFNSLWFNSLNWSQYYTGQEPFLTTEGVTEVGCVSLANTIVNTDLRRLVNFDILNLFGGIQNSLQMVHSSFELPTDLSPDGVFGGLKLEPEGCEPFYFSNGTRGISSKYLQKVTEELSKIDPSVKVGRHENIMRAIRREFESVKPHHSHQSREITPYQHSYYLMLEDKYSSSRGREETHIWMTQDLCLFVASKYSGSIRAKIIDDLNRLQHLLKMYTGAQLPQPSLQGYLPGTLEEQYREKGLTEISTG